MTEVVEPKMRNTASIDGKYYCKTCGWPIVHTCCNDGMSTQKPYAGHDWWEYCSNKTCKHHKGEGRFQDMPAFVGSVQAYHVAKNKTVNT